MPGIAGANGLFAGPASTDWADQFYNSKIGRAPFAEARRRAAEKNTVHREDTALAGRPVNNWFESFFKAKYGVTSPLARIEEANIADRAPANAVAANTWHADHCKAKYGYVPSAFEKK